MGVQSFFQLIRPFIKKKKKEKKEKSPTHGLVHQ